MHVIYPQSALGRHVDEQYMDESKLMCEKFGCSYMEYDDLVLGHGCTVPNGKTILYRGWPLPLDAYEQLDEVARAHQSQLLISPEQYALTRNMRLWHPLVKDLCAPTTFVDPHQSFEDIPYPQVLVRNVVRAGHSEVKCEKATLPQQLRSLSWDCLDVDHTVAVRAYEEYTAHHRLFVYNKQVYSYQAPGEAVALGLDVARRIHSPFFALDVAQKRDGEWRVWDIEDGQVAELNEWPVEKFVGILHKLGPEDQSACQLFRHRRQTTQAMAA